MWTDPLDQEYWNNGFIYNLKSRLKHRTKHGRRLCVDMELKTKVLAHWNGQFMERSTHNVIVRTDRWTDVPAEALQEAGYKRVKGMYDSLLWWNVPVYLQIHGGKKFDLSSVTDPAGNPLYSMDTSATLHDAMQSNATLDFIKGMGKTSMSSMDLQKIIMIAIVGVGAVFGLYMMGII